jgi:hypothetical protein
MNNLTLHPILFESPRNELHFIQRQQFARITASPAEICERQPVTIAIDCRNAERTARTACLILDRRHLDRNHTAQRRIIKLFNALSPHHPGRQMEQQINDTCQPKTRQRLCQSGANALEDFNLCKERVEDIGSHVYRGSS